MIEAKKSRMMCGLLSRNIEGRIRQNFACMRVFGRDQFSRLVADEAVLVVSNHTSVWDSMFLVWMSNRLLAMDGYALMDARSLRRRPFLGRVGGFGVELDDPADRSAVLRYAAGLLDKPGRVVWIFPQGAEYPLTVPLQFQAGFVRIAQLAGVERVVPVAFRYEMGEVEKPYFYVAFGEPVPVGATVESTTTALQDAVTRQLQRIDQFLTRAPDTQAPEELLCTRPGLFSALGERMLAWMTRYR